MEESGYIKSDQDFPKDACRCCGYSETHIFYELKSVPANSCILIPTREEALVYPKGDIILGFCLRCGFISNLAFDPDLAEYSDRYEGTQSFSPTFNAFQKELALQLVERYGLRNKNILEIGCGQGEFLALLCEMGGNRGYGFDPSLNIDQSVWNPSGSVHFIKDYFTEKYSNYPADFVCCKMTLEHIPSPFKFIMSLRRSIGKRYDTVVFFQVPNAFRIIEEGALEDIYYEHCSYFSPGSLARLFRKAGFDILQLYTEYDGQYLMIEAKATDCGGKEILPAEDDLKILGRLVAVFQEKMDEKVKFWKTRIRNKVKEEKKIVLWGSGSKASAFISFLELDNIEYIVDINSKKHGYYMPGTGQKIVPPDFLKDSQPDTVIVMNPVYTDEIRKHLGSMGIEAELLAL